MGKNRQQLIQEYEDAKLALLLDEYAEVYGKVSAELYEKDVALGKSKPISEEEQQAQLNAILKRAEAEESKKVPTSTHFKGIARKAATIAAAIATFFLLMVSVQAAGIDIFGTVGRWTDNLFHFGSREGTDQDIGVKEQTTSPAEEIITKMVAYGFPVDLAPSWIPNGFSVKDVSFPENADYHGIAFVLDDPNDNWILIQIDAITSNGSFDSEWIEKDAESVESILSNNKQFYIFQNDSTWTGVYQSEVNRMSVIDSTGKEDLLQIICSIGESNND